jgi:hypothetical protein
VLPLPPGLLFGLCGTVAAETTRMCARPVSVNRNVVVSVGGWDPWDRKIGTVAFVQAKTLQALLVIVYGRGFLFTVGLDY